MKKLNRILAVVIAVIIVVSLCPIASASGMTASDNIVACIKEWEGYRQYAYADAGGWYIGYGVKCEENQYPEGITVEEADILLRQALMTYEDELNEFAVKYGISFTQQQFDALVSFTYNNGGNWLRGSGRFVTYLKNGISNYTDIEIVDAMGVWSHMSKVAVPGLVARRIDEARIFLYGDYDGTSSPDYCYLILDLQGGELENDLYCYEKGKPYGTLPKPYMEGYRFVGWETSDGKMLNSADTVTKGRKVTAVWKEGTSVDFTDVPDEHMYYDAIAYCYQRGIMEGISETEFAPDNGLNRAMIVTVLWRLAGEPIVESDITFKDVKADVWYTEAIRWANSVGIVTGYSEDKFGTADNVTRQQLATFMYRFAVVNGADTNIWDMTLDGYSDAEKVAEYAYEPMCWALINDMIYAPDGYLYAKDAATRAETAKALMMYLLLY